MKEYPCKRDGRDAQCFVGVSAGRTAVVCTSMLPKSGYESEGRQFESVRARHDFNKLQTISGKDFPGLLPICYRRGEPKCTAKYTQIESYTAGIHNPATNIGKSWSLSWVNFRSVSFEGNVV